MKWNPITRRHFLEGTGATLLLPLLPSLLPRNAAAQTLIQKNLICIPTFHGLMRDTGPNSDLMPVSNVLNGTLEGYASYTQPGRHRIHYKSLLDVKNQYGKISRLIDADFNPYLAKMNMLQGMDITCIGELHHSAHFGNTATSSSAQTKAQPMASIDQVAANSLGFYKNSNLKRTSVAYTDFYKDQVNNGTCYAYTNPNDPLNSPVIHKPAFYNPATLWDAFFGGTSTNPALKSSLVDKVLGDYNVLRTDRNLAAEDKVKLDNHIAMIFEAQKKITSISTTCAQLRPPASLTEAKQLIEAMNTIIVALISCGLCHSFHGWSAFMNSTDENQWHNDWAHACFNPTTDTIANQVNYDKHLESTSMILKSCCLDLVKKLDQAGQLDKSLVVWVQEHSRRGHYSLDFPVITFGSAGGVFKTGQYVDYRRLGASNEAMWNSYSYGYPHAQFLANCLRAVDVPIAEYEALNKAEYTDPIFKSRSGYSSTIMEYFDKDTGTSKPNGNIKAAYSNWTGHDLSSWLPLIKV
jgi:hypothetical protein